MDSKPEKEKPLSEKDFIQNGKFYKSWPFWLWPFLLATLILLLMGTTNVYKGFIQREEKNDPFLQVTNREFSVFLWQFPSFLKNNVPKKTGYLTGFSSSEENFLPEKGDDYITAPPDLLFLYHTWKRLLSSAFSSRAISGKEFAEFLQHLPEWQPSFWKKASKKYAEWVAKGDFSEKTDLENFTQDEIPLIVRQAFQGWKNYYKEGPEINRVQPTVGQMRAFLEKNPHYSRNFWRNIQEIYGIEVAGDAYLLDVEKKEIDEEAVLPKEQVPSFLRVAFFNSMNSTQRHEDAKREKNTEQK